VSSNTPSKKNSRKSSANSIFRREVYPLRVKMKVMRQEEADRRIAILAAIAKDYDEVLNATESDGNDEDNRTA
jgi:hypothetical protein